MTNKVDIVRKAASLLKSTGININDIDNPETNLEVTLGLWYDSAKEIALSSSLWSFAINTRRLTQNSEVPGFGYKQKYNLPTDLVIPAYYYTNDTNRIFHKEFGGDVMGIYLFTKSEYDTIDMMYVANVTEGYMSQTFAAYLASELALYASNEINASDSEVQSLNDIREDLYNKAVKVDSSKRDIRIIETPGSVSSTNPYGGGIYNSQILQYEDL